jgi:hypothetical protein
MCPKQFISLNFVDAWYYGHNYTRYHAITTTPALQKWVDGVRKQKTAHNHKKHHSATFPFSLNVCSHPPSYLDYMRLRPKV